ncbi:MAG: hypothetical protein U0796_02645 [Gemmatales bacterium]
MASRRTLIQGLSPKEEAEQKAKEAEFVYGTKQVDATQQIASRISLTTRLRADLFEALKRASLERQLKKIQPHKVQDILDAALEPWLKQNGFL